MQNNKLYKRLGMAIEIDLHYKGYVVRANQRLVGAGTYVVTLELRRKDIGKWSSLNWDTLSEEVFHIKSKNIGRDTANFVWDKFAEGYFKPFIDRYEYEIECIEAGIAMDENKRIGGNNDECRPDQESE